MAKRKKTFDAAAASKKWLAAMQSPAAQANYKAGTAGKGAAAMQAANTEAAEAKYLAGVQAAVSNGTRATSLADPMAAQMYNQNTQGVGATNLGNGAQKKQAKYQAALQKLSQVYVEMRAAADAVDPTHARGTASARAAAALAVLMAAGKHAQP